MTDNKRIWLSLARMGGQEQRFIQEAFDTNWVVPLGPNVDGFERDLESFLGIEAGRVVALGSGTAAIHLALIALGVKQQDEVICQSFTFSASANPIMYLGATPVFIDSEGDTWNMCPQALEAAIKDRIKVKGCAPKAIIPVHLYGMPAKMDEILEVAGRYNIPVLEDAAEALGSSYKGQFCGTFGRFACLSFNGNKMITTSGGGALVCPSVEDASQIKFLATQARDNAAHYQHSQVGYNYRLSNICAGIGRGQMLVLNSNITARRTIHHHYSRTMLSAIPGLTFLTNPPASPSSASSPQNNFPKAITNSLVESDLSKRELESKLESNFDSNMWLTCIVVNPAVAGFTREDLRLTMEAANIETRPLWKPMHLQPLFASCPFYTTTNESFPNTISNSLINKDLGKRESTPEFEDQAYSGKNFPKDLKLGSMENRTVAIDSNLDNSISGILFEHGLCLPSHPGLTESDLERIVGVIKKLAKQ